MTYNDYDEYQQETQYDSSNDNTIRLENLLTVNNSMMWYIAFIPVFGLVFEIYATSRYLGYFLWGLIIATRILVCIHDNKKLIKMGVWESPTVSPLVLLPIMYMFKRSKLQSGSIAPAWIAIACLFFCAVNNGFTEAAAYNENNYYTFVDEYYSTYIYDLSPDVNYVYNTSNTIGGLLNRYCIPTTGKLSEDSFISYEYEYSGGEHYVTASAVKDGQKLAIVFRLDYDGYYFGGLYIDEITLGEETLEGEQREQMLRDIFMLALNDE